MIEDLLSTRNTYVICTTPRSGSNLLCDLLWQSDVMGYPQEYLNIEDCMLKYAKDHSYYKESSRALHTETYFKQMIERFSSSNHVFGMKVLFDQLEPIIKIPAIKKILGNSTFIWLQRRDLIAQSISMYIAKETNIWSSLKETEASRNNRKFIAYNHDKIDCFTKYLEALNQHWTQFFLVNEVDFLTIYYEDLIAHPDSTCQDICSFCGIKTDHQFLLEKANLEKQGTSINQDFYSKYKALSPMNVDNISDFSGMSFRNVNFIS